MFFYQQRIHGQIGVHGIGYTCHFCHLLHHYGIMYRFVCVFSPRERTVVLYQYSGSMYRVQPLKAFYDDISRFQFIRSFHFLLRHVCCAGYGVVEVIGMCCPDIRYVTSGLCPGCGVSRVRVHHTADFGECFIENQVGRCV